MTIRGSSSVSGSTMVQYLGLSVDDTLMSTLSRTDVLDAITKAKSLEEVVTLTNAHMGLARKGWGDSLELARKRAVVWYASSFPLAGPFSHHALPLARILACFVLAPDPLDLGKYWADFNEAIAGVGGLQENEDSAHLTGLPLTFVRYPGALEGAVRLYPDWSDIEALGGLSPEGKKSGLALSKAGLSKKAEDLLGLGFSKVMVGPAGGVAKMQEHVETLHAGMLEWATWLGVDPAFIGLGLGLSSNTHITTSYAAYSAATNELLFGFEPRGHAHEWSHAYEAWLDGPGNAPGVNVRLREAIASLSPDPALEKIHEEWMGRRLEEELAFVPGAFCEDKGNTAVRGFFEKNGRAPPELMEPTVGWISGQLSDKTVVDRISRLFEHHKSPDSAPLNTSAIEEFVSSCRQVMKARLASQAEVGQSVFARHAAWTDRSGLDVTLPGYWLSMSEKIARAAESVVEGRVSPLLISPHATAKNRALLYPKGLELEALRPLMATWYQHLATLHPASPQAALVGSEVRHRLQARRNKGAAKEGAVSPSAVDFSP